MRTHTGRSIKWLSLYVKQLGNFPQNCMKLPDVLVTFLLAVINYWTSSFRKKKALQLERTRSMAHGGEGSVVQGWEAPGYIVSAVPKQGVRGKWSPPPVTHSSSEAPPSKDSTTFQTAGDQTQGPMRNISNLKASAVGFFDCVLWWTDTAGNWKPWPHKNLFAHIPSSTAHYLYKVSII